MRLTARLVVLLLLLVLCSLTVTESAWATTNWLVHVVAANAGEAHANALPSAPGSVTAACAAPTTAATVTVRWAAVTHAKSYSVYEATTSATSGTLTASTNYWFEVLALVGTTWSSAKSSASPESTMHSSDPFCVQP
jgi:hypothetical protein